MKSVRMDPYAEKPACSRYTISVSAVHAHARTYALPRDNNRIAEHREARFTAANGTRHTTPLDDIPGPPLPLHTVYQKTDHASRVKAVSEWPMSTLCTIRHARDSWPTGWRPRTICTHQVIVYGKSSCKHAGAPCDGPTGVWLSCRGWLARQQLQQRATHSAQCDAHCKVDQSKEDAHALQATCELTTEMTHHQQKRHLLLPSVLLLTQGTCRLRDWTCL